MTVTGTIANIAIPTYGLVMCPNDLWGVYDKVAIGRFDVLTGAMKSLLPVTGTGTTLTGIAFVSSVRAPSGSPQLTSPQQNATNVTISPSLEWGPVASAGYYVLELAKNQTFTQSLITRTRINGTTSPINGLDYATTYYWRVLACNEVGSGPWSAIRQFTTTVPAPSISTHPSNATVTEGQTATFTVAATGTAPLSYRWQKGTTNITGATAASYTTPVTTMADNGATFRCVVTNAGGSATSDAATLTVNAAIVAPSISTHPSNATVTEGQTATFTVTAAGTAPLSYRWQKGTTNITGAIAATYTTPVTTMADTARPSAVL